VDELMLSFGDNDGLAARVTNLVRAPLLVILSDVDGLYDGDPQQPGVKLVSTVSRVDAQIESYACDQRSGLSKGGMVSKLRAAKMVTAAGENMIIASGRQSGLLGKILDGQLIGTLFLAQGKSITPWKRWIGFSAQPRGRLVLDSGACQAITRQGRSLLAIGILRVEGSFQKGDIVALHDQAGIEMARGLTNYRSDEIQRIQGLRSKQIAEVLGHRPYEEVVHRDNLVLLPGADAADFSQS
jgi:glutamate 5-kinase